MGRTCDEEDLLCGLGIAVQFVVEAARRRAVVSILVHLREPEGCGGSIEHLSSLFPILCQ